MAIKTTTYEELQPYLKQFDRYGWDKGTVIQREFVKAVRPILIDAICDSPDLDGELFCTLFKARTLSVSKGEYPFDGIGPRECFVVNIPGLKKA